MKALSISQKHIMHNITLKVKVRNIKKYKIRIWIGLVMIKLATKIMGIGMKLQEAK